MANPEDIVNSSPSVSLPASDADVATLPDQAAGNLAASGEGSLWALFVNPNNGQKTWGQVGSVGLGKQQFGTGTDGALDVLNGVTLHIQQDGYFTNVTVENGGHVVFDSSWRMYGNGTLHVKSGGRISFNGNDAALENGGVAQNGGTNQPGFGGAKGTTGPGADGSAWTGPGMVSPHGGNGGKGGDVGVTAGGNGGVNVLNATAGRLERTETALAGADHSQVGLAMPAGGAGGGSGAGDNAATKGGGGGGGAGMILFAFPRIILDAGAVIEAHGGAGGNANGAGDGGGGGGGGGGILMFVANKITVAPGASLDVGGGPPGNPVGTGNIGVKGDDGAVFVRVLSA